MWWVMAAQAAIGAINSWTDRQQAKINTRLSQVAAETGNTIRQAQNAMTASRNNLSRFMQSINNQNRMRAGGDALEAATTNYLRTQDALSTASFGDQIRFMEKAGASRVAQANSGADGTVADMVNGATALRRSMIEQRFEDAQASRASDQSKRAEGIFRSMVDGLDSSVIFDNLDYRTDTATKYVGPKWQHAAAMAVIGNTGSTKQAAIEIGDMASKAYDRFFTSNAQPSYISQSEIASENARRFGGSYDTGVSLSNIPAESTTSSLNY